MKQLNKKITTPFIETIKLGIFFFLLQTPFISFQTIITYIYQNQKLTYAAPINFILNYAFFLLSNIFAVNCRLKFKSQFIIGCFGHTFNVATGILIPFVENQQIKYIIIGLGGSIAGLTGGFLYISQGGYLREAIKTQQDKGKYSGIFQVMYSLAGLSAGLMTMFFLGFYSNQVYFISLTILSGLSGVFAFIFLKDYKEERIVQLQQNIINDLKSSFNYYKIMQPILMILALDSIVVAIQYSQVFRLLPDEPDKTVKDKFAGILTIFIGIGSIISGLISGLFCDKFGLFKTGKSLLSFYIFSALCTIYAIYFNKFQFTCFIGFLWGYNYYFFQTFISVSILKLYSGSLQAFSINKQVHCLSFVLFQIILILTQNQINLTLLMLIIIVLAIPGWWGIKKEIYQMQDKKNCTQPSLLEFDD